MALRFANVLEEIEEAFFYPSDLVNTVLKQLSPSGSVRSGGYIRRRFTSRYIYISTTIHLPFGG